MCGIVGFVSKEKNKKKTIKRMADTIAHRGPDGEGFYVDKTIALGHRRLSIIDLNNGSQPIYNEDRNLVIIFNGEIYNYQELKNELLERKHDFKTNSDTEVLLHGFEEWGIDLPKKLRGMFAFVIWDKDKQILFGARDHFGIKPFYYYRNEDLFMFASEIKALLVHPNFKKVLNRDVIGPYLAFNYNPDDETFFKGVFRLNPGHSFLFKDEKMEIIKYFNLEFNVQDESFEKNVNDIAAIMKDSIQKHMISDVEVGSFLSSGIDSSYIVSLAKCKKTYTVGYENPKYNEIDYAKDLADKLDIQNKSKIITKEEYLSLIPKIQYQMDEPLADPAAVSLYLVSKLASSEVKVVLSGEGADEFFGGYNYYLEEVRYNFYNKIPFCLRKIVSKTFVLLPEFKYSNFFIRRGKKVEDYYIGVNRIFHDNELKKILNNKNMISSQTYTKKTFEEQKGQANIIKMQAIDINNWLAKDILHKADRMTMANSVEVRVPFLDVEVFKVANTLPFSAKLSDNITKIALREAAKKIIPNEAYKKKKLGFPVPLREWIKDEAYYKKIYETFNLDIAKEIFIYDEIISLLEEHKNNKKDNYMKIWTIYCFIVWYQEFFINI